jgi:hypothetical protein
LIKSLKDDYGLFRAARFHNPACIRALMVLAYHYALMQERANNLSIHCKQACVDVRLLAL